MSFSGLALAQSSTIPESQSQTGFGGTHSIVGTVFGPSGRPLETPVRIRISSFNKGDRVFNTNSTGNFAFRGLPTGSYTISIDQEKDFEPFRAPMEVYQGERGQTYTLNIRLVSKGVATAKAGVVNAEIAKIPEAARTHYTNAVLHGSKGEHEKAVELLQLAVQAYPQFMHAYSELGVQYLRLGKLQEADDAFQSALKITPDEQAVMTNRGIAIFLMGRHGEAVPILRKVVAKDDKSAVGHYFLGQSYANLGLFDLAEKSLLTALKLGKDEMREAHRILAIIYGNNGDKPKQISSLETYLKLAPDAADADQLKQVLAKLKG